MKQYKKVNNLFEGLQAHVTASQSLITRPHTENNGQVFIEAQILQTLDDGMKIELCLWTDCDLHMSFWDVSIEKQLFHAKGETDFPAYLERMGLFLENVQERYGKWCYVGGIADEECYRVQYYEED